MDNLKLLDEIILSDNVVNDFYKEYTNNEKFKTWLLKIIPEIDLCEKQQQNNPWHKYNVLGHILHSVEAINELSKHLIDKDRKILAYTMLFHDIGKPECHITREKNGEMIDSFFNHNVASSKIANRVLPHLGFTEDEIKIISKLVFKHDIFMYIKTFKSNNRYWRVLSPKLIDEEITDLSKVGDGVKLMRYLVMVGRADNLAQNEKMTGESLNMLKRFDEMLDMRNMQN